MLLEPKIRIRIAGMVIKDEKLLLLKGKGYKELWTPGGKVDNNETDEGCLKRELREEMGVEITDMKFYKEYSTISFYNPSIPMKERVYIVLIRGKIEPSAEIESFVWFSKDDFYSKKYPMITHTEKELIPDLIRDNIW
jgi:8-oxo-dGTP diphosphatase